MACSATWLEHKRNAEAALAVGGFASALEACHKGAACIANPHKRDAEFLGLADRIAVKAALHGDFSPFDGRRLEVRPADPQDAWMGLPAPPAPALDAPASSLLLPGTAPATPAVPMQLCSGDTAPSAATGMHASTATAPSFSFRSLADALEAARDGDVITLLPGTHNVSQAGLYVTRRVLLRAAQGLGSAVIDHKANVPLLRITRACVLQDLEVDVCGFREALLITGGSTNGSVSSGSGADGRTASGTAAWRTESIGRQGLPAGAQQQASGVSTCQPLLIGCRVRCSGDDGVHITGDAAPLLHRCEVQARKCGVRVFGRAQPVMRHCTIADCGGNGVAAGGDAVLTLEHCGVARCGEDGVVGMQNARMELHSTTVEGCSGPAVDCSQQARVVMRDCDLRGCVGGLWLWQQATAEAVLTHISGGTSYAVLLDADAHASGSACSVDGPVHYNEAPRGNTCRQGGAGGVAGPAARAGTLVDASMLPADAAAAMAALPPATGPFVWEPPAYQTY